MDVLNLTDEQLFKRLCSHISKIYGDDLTEELAEKLRKIFEGQQISAAQVYDKDELLYWSEKDVFLITYGN